MVEKNEGLNRKIDTKFFLLETQTPELGVVRTQEVEEKKNGN